MSAHDEYKRGTCSPSWNVSSSSYDMYPPPQDCATVSTAPTCSPSWNVSSSSYDMHPPPQDESREEFVTMNKWLEGVASTTSVSGGLRSTRGRYVMLLQLKAVLVAAQQKNLLLCTATKTEPSWMYCEASLMDCNYSRPFLNVDWMYCMDFLNVLYGLQLQQTLL